jgi:hypothetical protein
VIPASLVLSDSGMPDIFLAGWQGCQAAFFAIAGAHKDGVRDFKI